MAHPLNLIRIDAPHDHCHLSAAARYRLPRRKSAARLPERPTGNDASADLRDADADGKRNARPLAAAKQRRRGCEHHPPASIANSANGEAEESGAGDDSDAYVGRTLQSDLS